MSGTRFTLDRTAPALSVRVFALGAAVLLLAACGREEAKPVQRGTPITPCGSAAGGW